MRNKIKEIMNKEEGFTLVELLAVIVILGIIVAIAIPAIGSVIDRADDGAEKAEQALVVDAARLYFTTTETDEKWVSVGELKKLGYLEERGTDEDGNTLSEDAGVLRKENSADDEEGVTTYTYEYRDSEPTS